MLTGDISESQFTNSLFPSLYCDLFFKISTMILESKNKNVKFQKTRSITIYSGTSFLPGIQSLWYHFLPVSLEVSGTFPPLPRSCFLPFFFVFLFSVSLLGGT